MLKYDIDTLDIKKIADSGQTFRMFPSNSAEPLKYRCFAADKACTAGNGVIDCAEEENSFWQAYFDLDTDYEAVIDSIDPDDTYLCAAADEGRGIRILRQDPWEMLITFIISQRRSIPSIKTCTESLCRAFGAYIDPDGKNEEGHFAFPSPEALAQASMEKLASCGLGYRTEYVYLASKAVAEGSLDLKSLADLSDEALLEALMSLRGVGPKVANCVSLFGFYRIGAFPIDVWIDRVLKEHYPLGFPFERYEGYAGILQQYMFYAARKH